MEDVWAVIKEVSGFQVVRTLEGDVRKGGILRVRQDLEGECGGEGGVAALGVAQEDATG